MQKFLVVSYDDDQQQWFWDFVMANHPDGATAQVCERRPYVIAADAVALSGLQGIATRLSNRSPKEITQQFLWDTKDQEDESTAAFSEGFLAFTQGKRRLIPRELDVREFKNAAKDWYRGWDKANIAANEPAAAPLVPYVKEKV